MSADDQGDRKERDIARLIVAGHGDRYIAATLLISERTLYRLLERLMLRYGLPNRAALGAFAASRGWLPDYPPPPELPHPGERTLPRAAAVPGVPAAGVPVPPFGQPTR